MDKIYIPCAQRTRSYVGKGVQIEINPSQAANAITSVAKDSMMVEAKIIGFSRSSEGPGEVLNRPIKDVANCVTTFSCSGCTTTQYVYEGRIARVNEIANIVNTGAWESSQRGRIYDPTCCSPALNTCQGGGLEPKILITKQRDMESEIVKRLEARAKKVADLFWAECGAAMADDCITPLELLYASLDTIKERLPKEDCATFDDWLAEDLGANNEPLLLPTDQHKPSQEEDEEWEYYFRIRKLTPKECFRLMGVSDEDIEKIQNYREEKTLKSGKKKAIEISKSQQYKMAGNSIVVDCLDALFTMALPLLLPQSFAYKENEGTRADARATQASEKKKAYSPSLFGEDWGWHLRGVTSAAVHWLTH